MLFFLVYLSKGSPLEVFFLYFKLSFYLNFILLRNQQRHESTDVGRNQWHR
jgi:hypothetical protein